MANKIVSSKDLRQFGWVTLIGFGLVGAMAWFRHHQDAAIASWAASILLTIAAWAVPVLGVPLYRGWMALGKILGSITTPIILTAIFLVIITPIALFFRLLGRDSLGLKKAKKNSYWVDHPRIEGSEPYRHLY